MNKITLTTDILVPTFTLVMIMVCIVAATIGINSLMKGKKDNAAQRDIFFEERKREMKETASKQNAETVQKNKEMEHETKEVLENKDAPSLLNNINKIDNTEIDAMLKEGNDELTETVESLQESDPWLERKINDGNGGGN